MSVSKMEASMILSIAVAGVLVYCSHQLSDPWAKKRSLTELGSRWILELIDAASGSVLFLNGKRPSACALLCM
jgi:hypothetical protein